MRLAIAFATALCATTVSAGTTEIDLAKLPSQVVMGVAEVTPLLLSAEGRPSVVILSLDADDVVPPHATRSGVRLLTVISGEMSWGDGDTVVEADETIYGPGSVLTVPAGVRHWLAARNGPVALQLIVLDDETPVPAMQEQMQ
ncbi:MAG: cupin domain-containing protein [Pseudomonadota bacterium]